MYYLDTNTVIYMLNGKYPNVKKHILNTHSSEIRIPAIVKSELLYGAYKSNRRESVLEKLNVIFDTFKVENYTDEMSDYYAQIRSELERIGQPIGPNDLFIAATVLGKSGVLVTNNTKEFSRVNGLKIQNWTLD